MTEHGESRKLPKLSEKQDLLSIWKNAQQNPISVSGFAIKGNKKTNEDVFNRVFQSALEANTVEELVSRLRTGVHRLSKVDAFESVVAVCDKGVLDNTANIIIHCKEKGMYQLEGGRSLASGGTGENSVNATGTIRNFFGWAESISTNLSYGTRQSSSLTLNYNQPVFRSDKEIAIDTTALKVIKNYVVQSSHAEKVKGILTRVTYKDDVRHLRHELAYEAAWRQVCQLPANASWDVRRNAGHSLKSSLKYTIIRDFAGSTSHEGNHNRADRDSGGNVFYSPEVSGGLRLSIEGAGLGGDVKFVKNEAAARISLDFEELGCAVVLHAEAAATVPLFGDKVRINDRSFLGGAGSTPGSFRGFRSRGLGPSSHSHSQHSAASSSAQGDGIAIAENSIGGCLMSAVHASVLFPLPLPFLIPLPLRCMLFASAGNVASVDTLALTREFFVDDFLRTGRVSVGGGIVLNTQFGQIELTYAVPIVKHEGDRTRHFQVGVSMLSLN